MSISYTYSAGTSVGEVLSAAHFGSNMLFRYDTLGVGDDFPEVVEKIGIEVLRYPGGTMTETHFDLGDPTATTGDDLLIGGHTDTLLGIDTFLSYCIAESITPIIVIPTYQYFNQTTRGINAAAEAEIKAFIGDVLDGDYGAIDIHAFEIGNEFEQGKFNWTDAEFAAVQHQIAVWINEAIAANASSQDPDIWVQSGKEASAYTTLSGAFSGDIGIVDGIVTHCYATNSSGDPLATGGGIGTRLSAINAAWNVVGNSLDLIVTEWNIGDNDTSEDDEPEETPLSGLIRSAALIRVFSELAEHGVDWATLWTAVAKSPAALSTSVVNGVSDGSDLTATGYLYRMMNNALQGTLLDDPSAGFKLEEGGEDVAYHFTFQSADNNHTVAYFASGVSEDVVLSLNYAALLSANMHVQVTILGVASGAADDYRADAMITTYTIENPYAAGVFDFTLGAFETLQIEFTLGTGVNLFGDDQNVTADLLTGTSYDDQIKGDRGADILTGLGGADVIYGDQGGDVIDGGSGNDTLFGGSGDDDISGGSGDDIIKGGGHADVLSGGDGLDDLRGGSGGDAMHGGDGADILIGETGADSLWGDAGNDVVNGGKGNDLLYGGEGDDTLNGGDNHDNLWGGAGEDDLTGGLGNDFLYGDGDDDILRGGRGADLLKGGAGNDTLIGGRGDDIINGSQGDDVLSGGLDDDVFKFYDGYGLDQVLDFTPGEDSLVFNGDIYGDLEDIIGQAGMTISVDVNDDVLINYGSGDHVIIVHSQAIEDAYTILYA